MLAEDGDIMNTKWFRNPRLHKVLDSTYTDSTALFVNSYSAMNRTIQKFAHVTGKFGMVINERKTVVMRYDPASTDPQPVSIENTELQDVETVNYLGSTICPRNDMSAEFGRRVGLARSSFFRLKQRLWNQRGIRKCTKVRMFSALVMYTLLYGSGSWTRRELDTNQPETTPYCLARLMLGSRSTDHVHMTTAYHKLGMVPLRVQLTERTLSWAARLINLPGDWLPRLVMFSQLVEGRQNRVSPTL